MGLVSSPATAQTQNPVRTGVTGWRPETSFLPADGSDDASPTAAPPLIFCPPPLSPLFPRMYRSSGTAVTGFQLLWLWSMDEKLEAGAAALPEC